MSNQIIVRQRNVPPQDGEYSGSVERGDEMHVKGANGGVFINVGTRQHPRWRRKYDLLGRPLAYEELE